MTVDDKDRNRLMFKWTAVVLVTATLIAGIGLAVASKLEGFAGIAAGIMTFAAGVFGADYFSKPSNGGE